MKRFFSQLLWLWQMSKGLRGAMFLICLVGTLRIGASLSFVWFCKHLVDMATGLAQGSLLLYIVLMLSCITLSILLSGVASWLKGQNSIQCNNTFRRLIFSTVMKSRWDGTDRFHSGDAMNRLQEDIRVVSGAVSQEIPGFILTLVQLVAASSFLFLLDARLLWVILILMPLAVLVSKMFYRRMKQLTLLIRSQESAVQIVMQEGLQRRLLILTLSHVERTLEKLERFQQQLLGTFHERLTYQVRSRVLLQFGFSAGYCVAFLWGIFGLKAGTVTFGTMTAFLQLVAQVQRPIVSLTQYIPTFISLVTSIERLDDLTALPQEEAGETELLEGPAGIRLDGVDFCYPGTSGPVLEGLSFDFAPGSTTAIVGRTGAGKSTLVRLLLGVLRQQSGTVTVYNRKKQVEASASTRCNFMYVPQGNSLMSGTVRENLLMGNPQATDEEMADALHQVSADFVLSSPEGLDRPCGETGAGLSQGQAQRIAIARALLQRGSILILDEASSALDARTEKEILESLRQLKGKTIIWVTHHAAVSDYMDRILTIEDQSTSISSINR